MNVVGLSTAVMPVSPAAIAAVPRVPPRRPGRGNQRDEIIDDVPYVIVEEPRQRARPAASRRARRSTTASATRAIWSAPSAGRRSSEQLQALRAYAPCYPYQGIFVDVWV